VPRLKRCKPQATTLESEGTMFQGCDTWRVWDEGNGSHGWIRNKGRFGNLDHPTRFRPESNRGL